MIKTIETLTCGPLTWFSALSSRTDYSENRSVKQSVQLPSFNEPRATELWGLKAREVLQTGDKMGTRLATQDQLGYNAKQMLVFRI